jgi:hypothetical protein
MKAIKIYRMLLRSLAARVEEGLAFSNLIPT